MKVCDVCAPLIYCWLGIVTHALIGLIDDISCPGQFSWLLFVTLYSFLVTPFEQTIDAELCVSSCTYQRQNTPILNISKHELLQILSLDHYIMEWFPFDRSAFLILTSYSHEKNCVIPNPGNVLGIYRGHKV